jgi:hypothetical protein
MESQHDIEQWAAETDLGRHIFNYNFRMTGNELRGWELLKTVNLQSEPGVTERVYMWQKKKSEGQQLVRISIAELPSWWNAQGQLSNELDHSMRPDIPRGTGKLANTGDINFIGKPPESKVVASMLFTRGNLSVSISSAGEKSVDVSKIAALLDHMFSEPPDKADVEKGTVAALSPKSLQVRENEAFTVIETIPEPVARGGWLKVIAPDGELRREDDALVYVSPKSGRKRIGKYLMVQ